MDGIDILTSPPDAGPAQDPLKVTESREWLVASRDGPCPSGSPSTTECAPCSGGSSSNSESLKSLALLPPPIPHDDRDYEGDSGGGPAHD